MNRRLLFSISIVAGLAALGGPLGGCHDSTGPDGDPGLHILEGGGQDTIGALMPEVRVLVRDSTGMPKAGITVRFSSTSSVPSWFVFPLSTHSDEWQQLDTTDADGRASARVRLGSVAGTGSMIVEARSLGFADTAHYEIRPGAPVRVAVTPKDTAIYTGGRYQLSGRVFDRFNNLRPEGTTIRSASAGLALEGTAVRATTTVGREFTVLGYQAIVDTAWTSVVPRGTVLARNGRYPRNGTFIITELDGSGFRVFLPQVPPELFGAWGDMGPAWTASGNEFVFHDGSVGKRLFISDLNGVVRPFLTSSVAGYYELWPALSRDGQWMYFSRGQTSESAAPWRARADGSGAEALPRDQVGGAWHVSPSPDGSQLAYETFGCGNNFAIYVLDIPSGVSRPLGVCGRSPRWSPSSDLIAYVGVGGLRVVRADGSGDRLLGVGANDRYELRLDWSPDGVWVIAQASGLGVLHLVHATSGLVLPLAFTKDLEQPAWRPVPPVP